ncbi:hypothetical protein N8680_02095, partial [Akkermansiaceae bacterium]|nr:hypothetical protein [Akkermansiaceae bacterium]
ILEEEDEHLRVWAIRLLTDEWAIDSVYGPMENRKVASDPELRDRFVKMAKEDQSGLVRLALASTLQRIAVEDRVVLAKALAQRVDQLGSPILWASQLELSFFTASSLGFPPQSSQEFPSEGALPRPFTSIPPS